MARPAIRGQNGTWSLRQAFTAAQVTERAARAIVARHLVGPDALTGADVLALKVTVALSRCALLDCDDPILANMRDADATRAARDCWYAPTLEMLLVSTSGETRLARTAAELSAVLTVYADRPVVLLPIGRWALDLQTRTAAA